MQNAGEQSTTKTRGVMTKPNNPTNDPLRTSLTEISRQAQIRLVRQCLALDITILQAQTLLHLEEHGATRMTVLNKELGITVSAATSLANRLVEKELIRRMSNPKDRRSVVCELTPKGRATMTEIHSLSAQNLYETLQMIRDDTWQRDSEQ